MEAMKRVIQLGTNENPEKKDFYRRKCIVGGEELRLLKVWFTYERYDRRFRDKKGKLRWKQATRDVMYLDGTFYKAQKNKTSDPELQKKLPFCEYVPITGRITAISPGYRAKFGLPDAAIEVVDGKPVRVEIGGNEFEVGDQWPVIENYLGLDLAWRNRKKSA
jgi:hypothetical protein